ncbi:hypothetical protein GCM10009715_28850 [Paeniglutamicibacter psychrophenolicus]
MSGIRMAAKANEQVKALKLECIQVLVFEPDQGLGVKHCRCSFQVASWVPPAAPTPRAKAFGRPRLPCRSNRIGAT